MIKSFLLFFIIAFTQIISAQNHSDAEFLRNLSYMKNAAKINCDSTSGTTLEHRICLNLEFQAVDSILSIRFNSFLKTIESDSTKIRIVDFQNEWIENRRLQSKIASEGFRGHMLGIYYLGSMVDMTRRRIEELEYFIGKE